MQLANALASTLDINLANTLAKGALSGVKGTVGPYKRKVKAQENRSMTEMKMKTQTTNGGFQKMLTISTNRK